MFHFKIISKLFYFHFLIFLLLIATSSLSLAKTEPVQFLIRAYVHKPCDDGEAVSVERLNIPRDAPYRFVNYTVRTTTQNSENNGYTVTYLPEQHQVAVKLTATRNGACWSLFGWHGPASWLGVEVTVNVIRNACDDPVPPPAPDGARVGPFLDAYRKTVAGLQCQVDTAQARRSEVIQIFEEKIKEKAAEKKGLLQVQIATERATLAQIEGITEEYIQAVSEISKEYADLIQEFSQTKELTTAKTNNELLDLANRARLADLKSISMIVRELIDLNQRESAYNAKFGFRGRRLLGQLKAADRSYQEKIGHFSGFMESKNLKRVELVSTAIESLNQIIRSSERRGIEYAKSINGLLDNIQRRESALVEAAADQETRVAMAGARGLQATSKFLEEVTEASKRVWEKPELSGYNNLPFLEADYLKKRKFLQYYDICTEQNITQSPWMHTGCAFVQSDLKAVEIYLRLSISRKIREGVRHFEASKSEKILRAFSEENVLTAVREYDAALRGSLK